MPGKVRVRVSTDGRITLPKVIRDQLGIAPGDILVIEELDGRSTVLLQNPVTWLDELCRPIREEAKARGITPEDIIRWVKEVRRERASQQLPPEADAGAPTANSKTDN
ncbi:MAG: AbrB/MazE/SpoVT family DNA-binding domain-containing protein [Armatimonadetes bacterium]|nr:AbrB/MazE/SpoVT family DNA-binding domain-containing protein [Armatimonadota bacterium]